MALQAITATPVAITVVGGQPVSVSAAVTLGLTSATASSGTSFTGTFAWPGEPGTSNTFWVATASTANLNYIT